VDENLTGRENLVLVARLCGLPKAEAQRRAGELLERFRTDRRRRPDGAHLLRRHAPAARPGGGAVDEPEVLFLDEPTTGLDPRSRNDLWSVIEQLVADGSTLLLTTQYLEEADRLADRIASSTTAGSSPRAPRASSRPTLGATVIEVGHARCRSTRPALPPRWRRSGRSTSEPDATRLPADRRRTGPAAMVQLVPLLDRLGLPPTLCPARAEPGRRVPQPHRAGRPRRRRHRRRSAVSTGTRGRRAAARGRRSPTRWSSPGATSPCCGGLPQLLVFATIQPVLFVLMFRYVFGGAIEVPNGSYVDYLMPGIFAQTVAFGAITTGIGLSEDLARGLIDRFRTLPMARSAVLAGRTLADLVRNVGVVALMVAMGYLVGFRVQTSLWSLLAAVLVLLLFGFAMSWVFALVGLSVPNAEGAQAASFPILFPLVFASSAFVPTSTMPGPLRAFAEHQPVTAVVDAVRALVLGGPTSSAVLTSLAWSVGSCWLRRHWRCAGTAGPPGDDTVTRESATAVRRVDYGYFVRPGEETGTGQPRVEACLGYLVEHPAGCCCSTPAWAATRTSMRTTGRAGVRLPLHSQPPATGRRRPVRRQLPSALRPLRRQPRPARQADLRAGHRAGGGPRCGLHPARARRRAGAALPGARRRG
jgi:ABC transporter DrrB family efflux protein